MNRLFAQFHRYYSPCADAHPVAHFIAKHFYHFKDAVGIAGNFEHLDAAREKRLGEIDYMVNPHAPGYGDYLLFAYEFVNLLCFHTGDYIRLPLDTSIFRSKVYPPALWRVYLAVSVAGENLGIAQAKSEAPQGEGWKPGSS
jgi:hypothetical protein